MKPTANPTDAKPIMRKIVKARLVAGVICITLPVALRDSIGIDNGDHLMITLDKRRRRLIVTKE